MAVRPSVPAHGPALGLTHRLLGIFHVTGVFWYRTHFWAVNVLPNPIVHVVILVFTAGFFVSLGRIRNAIAANLEPVLGPAGLWTRLRRAYRTMNSFAFCLSERYQRMAGRASGRMAIEGKSFWDEATAGGRGAVLVTSHIGPWETAAYAGAAEGQRVVHLVREEEIDPKAQAFIQELVVGDNRVVTHFAGQDPRLAIELAEALRRGELVALQGDRPRAGGRTVTAQIFGRSIPLPIGPAALARASEAPMLPIFSFREGTRAGRIVARPPITVARTADREADLSAAVHQLAREIEWAIRERPHQWFCFRRLWE